MKLRAAALTTVLALSATALPALGAYAGTAAPAKITAVSSRPGPLAGQLTISWLTTGVNVHHFRVETSLSSFRKGHRGRNFTKFYAGPSARSLTLTSSQLVRAGAPLGSANQLYFRLYAVSKGTSGYRESAFPRLQTQSVQPLAPTGRTPIRVASFNVRSARSSPASRSWTRRAPLVAKAILAKTPGIVALQETSPGPYTGRSGDPRQTDDLLAKVRTTGGKTYAMVRTTPYAKPHTKMGSQGARILYDSAKYRLLSTCPEKTGTSNWNGSCTIPMWLPAGDSEKYRRLAAYGQFQDRSTGRRFWFVSLHLDNRDASKPSPEYWETLRGNQIKTVTAALDKLDTAGYPIIVAGDFNTWQNTRLSYAPHNNLVAAGYYDTAAALRRVNIGYSTMNHFDTTVQPNVSGFGSRLDVIAVKGVRGASRYETVVAPKDSFRPSDHNLVVSDFAI